MSRHPFETPIPKRYSLGGLFATMTLLCIALWLASSEEGRILLGLAGVGAFLIFMFACSSWLLGTFGERQRREADESLAARKDKLPPQNFKTEKQHRPGF